jgi:Recombinase
VWAILRNPAYKDTACFNKTKLAPRQRITRPIRLRGGVAPRESAKQDRPREEWIEIPVPAIITEECFVLAQERLHANKVNAPRRTVTPSVVQGLVACRKCAMRCIEPQPAAAHGSHDVIFVAGPIVAADALPASDKDTPATPNAAVLRRFRFEACFACAM